ncbi:MAG: DUF2961 domain-containing protein [Pirellulales bacterium]|nr:DUF2961 domain-containing protein [Pirellulales bacterium]
MFRFRFPVLFAALAIVFLFPPTSLAADEPVRDLSWFLRRMRSVEHLPELEASHTAMASTWDRAGGNNDAADFKQIEKDGRNVLLDVDGPGCVHRIFLGVLSDLHAKTRIQIFLDGSDAAAIDMPLAEFFADRDGPLPYPLVFFKSYPGTLFPIPFAKHCRIQLVHPDFGKPEWDNHPWRCPWSNYWQIVYTTYPAGTRVSSLAWPPSEAERAEIERTCESWLAAESGPPSFDEKPEVDETFSLAAGQSRDVSLAGLGVIRQLRLAVEPATPEVLTKLRMRISFDGAALPGVDAPVGYFFGHAFTGHNHRAKSIAAVLGRRPVSPAAPVEYSANFHSLLLGVTETEAYARFPMPFANGAVLRLENPSTVDVSRIRLRMSVDRPESLPDNWGRFQATWRAEPAATPAVPKFGPKNVPCHTVLERRGRGKYVGVMLMIDWPHEPWWGEGDWLIWTDEEGWPPSYHGTGSEEYFNSGWCQFDRKAVSGFVALRPGHVAVYSFHLNDAFQFQRNVRVLEEQMGDGLIHSTHPLWGSTAYWYALPTRPAESEEE